MHSGMGGRCMVKNALKFRCIKTVFVFKIFGGGLIFWDDFRSLLGVESDGGVDLCHGQSLMREGLGKIVC